MTLLKENVVVKVTGMKRRVGRPKVDDLLIVFAHVEGGRRRKGLSVRGFAALRIARLTHICKPNDSDWMTRYLKGESLRRRFTEALKAIRPLPVPAGIGFPDGDPALAETQETIDCMLRDF